MNVRMRVARVMRSMNQTQLARLVGVSQSLISEIETELRIPSENQREAIAKALNFPVDQLWPSEGGQENG